MLRRLISKLISTCCNTKTIINQSDYQLKQKDLFYLSNFNELLSDIPGMITDESGKYLFTIAFTQSVSGDVVEIGSWVGKSTCYLAKAVKLSGNGKLYAIDHFKGNLGKEKLYRVAKADLSDLQAIFRKNLRKNNIDDCVVILDKASEEAGCLLKEKGIKIRLLFIDGDHSYKGVSKDFATFYDLVTVGGIIVFDDYSKNFPGVVQFVNELIEGGIISHYYSYMNSFVVRK